MFSTTKGSRFQLRPIFGLAEGETANEDLIVPFQTRQQVLQRERTTPPMLSIFSRSKGGRRDESCCGYNVEGAAGQVSTNSMERSKERIPPTSPEDTAIMERSAYEQHLQNWPSEKSVSFCPPLVRGGSSEQSFTTVASFKLSQSQASFSDRQLLSRAQSSDQSLLTVDTYHFGSLRIIESEEE